MSKLSVYPLIDETTQLIFWDNTIVRGGRVLAPMGVSYQGESPIYNVSIHVS